jgi:hypothetical protein
VGKLLSYTLDYDRTVPLDLWMPFDLKHRFVIELPPAFHFDGGRATRLSARSGARSVSPSNLIQNRRESWSYCSIRGWRRC